MPASCEASCFLKNQSGSRPCTVSLEDRGLVVQQGGAQAELWPYHQLKFELAGDEKSYVLISCPSAVSSVACVSLKDSGFRAALAKKLAPASRGILMEFHSAGSAQTGRRWRNVIIFLAACALLVAGAWYGLTRGLANWAARKMPVETEVKWGKVIATTFLSAEKVIDKGPAVDALQKIIDRLSSSLETNMGYQFELHLVDASMVNAMALPGGHIVVYTGLLKKAGSAEEVAGVLAHEIQHIIQRHVVKRTINLLGGRAVLVLVFGSGDLSALVLGGNQLLEMSYGRDQERESDRKGLELLDRAGIPLKSMTDFFEKMQKDEAVSVPEIMSTHPDTAERISELRKMISGMKPRPSEPLGINWTEVQSSLK